MYFGYFWHMKVWNMQEFVEPTPYLIRGLTCKHKAPVSSYFYPEICPPPPQKVYDIRLSILSLADFSLHRYPVDAAGDVHDTINKRMLTSHQHFL